MVQWHSGSGNPEALKVRVPSDSRQNPESCSPPTTVGVSSVQEGRVGVSYVWSGEGGVGGGRKGRDGKEGRVGEGWKRRGRIVSGRGRKKKHGEGMEGTGKDRE